MSRQRRQAGEAIDPIARLEGLGVGPRKRGPGTAPGNPEAADLAKKYRDALAVTAMLGSTLNLDVLLSNIIDGIISVTGCDRAFLMLREPDGSFSRHIGRKRDQAEFGEDERVSSTVVNRVKDTGEPYIALDVASEADLRAQKSIQHNRTRSVFCVPLTYGSELIGVIYADSRTVVPQVLESDRTILNAFSAQAALAIENAREHGELRSRSGQLEEQNISLRHQLAQEVKFGKMLSKSKRMIEIFNAVERYGPDDIRVLIHGETGTGKELLAQELHQRSARFGRPFQTVNCGSIPKGLEESTLFGHKKGAFTGAIQDRPGFFEIADGGTLFLDEIGEMPLSVQAKILRALQEGEVSRVGEDDRVRKVDVRVISATHVDLERAVEDGRFREDLFYRLKAARLELPPLRERREDIVSLAEHFLKTFSEIKGRPLVGLTRDAREFLLGYAWPGNVRELQSAMEWVSITHDADGSVGFADFERYFRRPDSAAATAETPGTLKERMAGFEEQVIRRVLGQNDYNVSAAARALDISRQQLHNKIRKLNITTRDD